MAADRFPSTWPFGLNLIVPPSDMRFATGILVWRTASASAFGLVVLARLNASAAIMIASKV